MFAARLSSRLQHLAKHCEALTFILQAFGSHQLLLPIDHLQCHSAVVLCGMDLCWLVFFPGRPSAGDWRREDAASRIANAALTHNSDCYIFFEDRTCIMLEPQLLQEWNGTEAMYRELSRAVVADNRIVGARFLNERVGLEEALHGLLARVLVDVQVVLDFREAGHMALGGFETRAMGAGTKALCVIGGVRDVRERETEVLTALCARLNVGMLKVSLGERPELTSKCIKASASALDTNLCQAKDPLIRECKLEGKPGKPKVWCCCSQCRSCAPLNSSSRDSDLYKW